MGKIKDPYIEFTKAVRELKQAILFYLMEDIRLVKAKSIQLIKWIRGKA